MEKHWSQWTDLSRTNWSCGSLLPLRRLLRRLEKLREIVARRLDVDVCQPDYFVDIAADPGLIETRMFRRRALDPTGRQKMHADIAL